MSYPTDCHETVLAALKAQDRVIASHGETMQQALKVATETKALLDGPEGMIVKVDRLIQVEKVRDTNDAEARQDAAAREANRSQWKMTGVGQVAIMVGVILDLIRDLFFSKHQ